MPQYILENLLEYNRHIQKYVIDDLNKEFKELTGIWLLSYRRFDKNGKLAFLFGDSEWRDIAYKHNWVSYSSSFKQKLSFAINSNDYLYQWPEKPQKGDAVNEALFSFGVWNCLSIYKRTPSFIEVFVFGGEASNTWLRYKNLENIPLIDQFILAFKERLYKPQKFFPEIILLSHDIKLDEFNLFAPRNLPQNLAIEGFRTFYKEKDIKLTHRQIEVLSYFSQGKTIKEVSSVFNVGNDDIKDMMKRLYNKLGLNYKNQLIQFYQEEVSPYFTKNIQWKNEN